MILSLGTLIPISTAKNKNAQAHITGRQLHCTHTKKAAITQDFAGKAHNVNFKHVQYWIKKLANRARENKCMQRWYMPRKQRK